MKYDALRDAGTSEEELEKIVQSDKILYEIWKKSIVTKAFPAYPQKHIKLLPTFNWDGAAWSVGGNHGNSQYASAGTGGGNGTGTGGLGGLWTGDYGASNTANDAAVYYFTR